MTSTPIPADETPNRSFLADLRFNSEPGIDGLLGANMESEYFETALAQLNVLIDRETLKARIDELDGIIRIAPNNLLTMQGGRLRTIATRVSELQPHHAQKEGK